MKKLLLLATLVLSACGEATPTTAPIERSQYGDSWPFSVDAGVLTCKESNQVVFVHNSDIYALNGAAKDSGKYRPIDSIWVVNSSGSKADLSGIISKGLSLCK